MKHKTLFSLIVIVATYIFSSYAYAQGKPQNGDGSKLLKINQRAYYQSKYETTMILTDSASKSLSLPTGRYFQLEQVTTPSGMDFPGAIVSVLGKEKIAMLSTTKKIIFFGAVNPSGKIVKLTISVPEEYQMSLEDCARLIELVKNKVTINVPHQVKGNMLGLFDIAYPVAFLKK